MWITAPTPFIYAKNLLAHLWIKLWINSDSLWEKCGQTPYLSTAPSCPQNYPQSYTQILPLLSTGLSTAYIRFERYTKPIYEVLDKNIHKLRGLSTVFVDNPGELWINLRSFSTKENKPLGGLWITFVMYAY